MTRMTRMWELILDPALDGATNMAIDGALLEEVENDPDPRTIVRFYTWSRPAVSLGRNQKTESAAGVAYCRARGIDIVHRPTGGRAVLHDDELTYAVVSNDPYHFGRAAIYDTYRHISEALSLGYRRLGIHASLAPETRKLGRSAGSDHPCFVSASRYELTVDGRKIAGSAQRRLRRSFLQHGSMPITFDHATLARATQMADASVLEGQVVGIAEVLGRRPTLQEIVQAFVHGFQEYFAVDFSLPAGKIELTIHQSQSQKSQS